jgi:adenine phosphoribosyltransferase
MMGQWCLHARLFMRNEHLLRLIRTIPDVPKPGIMFRDITPLLASPEGFAATTREIVAVSEAMRPTKVIGVEARGFILAAPVALQLGAGFVPVRKAGKLPWQVVGESYSLEYGTDRLEMHRDAVGPQDKVLIVDDVLATGGTAAATIRLVESCGATVAGLVFLIELEALNGRAALGEYEVESLLLL